MSDEQGSYYTANGINLSGPSALAMERISRMILNEAGRRMTVTKYQNRNAAIYEVLLEVSTRVGGVMASER